MFGWLWLSWALFLVGFCYAGSLVAVLLRRTSVRQSPRRERQAGPRLKSRSLAVTPHYGVFGMSTRNRKMPSIRPSARKRRRFGRIQWRSRATLLVLLCAVDANAAPPKLPLVFPPSLPIQCESDVCVQPISLGEQAPFQGQLLPTEHAIQLAQRAAHCDDEIDIEVARTASTAAVNLQYVQRIREIEQRTKEREIAIITRDRDFWRDVSSGAWYEQPEFIIPTTVVLTLGAVWLTGLLVDDIRERAATP